MLYKVALSNCDCFMMMRERKRDAIGATCHLNYGTLKCENGWSMRLAAQWRGGVHGCVRRIGAEARRDDLELG